MVGSTASMWGMAVAYRRWNVVMLQGGVAAALDRLGMGGGKAGESPVVRRAAAEEQRLMGVESAVEVGSATMYAATLLVTME